MSEENNVSNKKGIRCPGLIYLQLLEKCNLRCKMCYEWGENGTYHRKNKLKILEKEKVKDLIVENKEYNPHFWLYGGEPLLYPDLEEILHTIKENGCSVEMDTNGVLLKENAKVLINEAVQMVHISLDGPESINDSQRGFGVFQKIIEGINYLVKIKKEYNKDFPKISINTTITEKNYSHITKLFKECLDLDTISHISLELQTYLTREKAEQYKEFIRKKFEVENSTYVDGFITNPKIFEQIDLSILVDQIKQMEQICKEKNIEFNCYPKTINYDNCNAYFSGRWSKMAGNKKVCVFPWVYTEITAGGDVAPCHAFYDVTFGNIYQEKLLEIWNNKSYQKFRNECKKGPLPNCTACCLYYHNKY